MMTLCPFLCSNEIILKHAKSVVFSVASKVLKRVLEQLRTFYFRQSSEVFGNSSEIFGSRWNVSGNLGHDKVQKENRRGKQGILWKMRKWRI